MGKVMWPIYQSPSKINLPSKFQVGINGLNGTDAWGVTMGGGLRYYISTNLYNVSPGTVPYTPNPQASVLVRRTGTTLAISIDGTQRYQVTTNAVSQISGLVFTGSHGAANSYVDNFHYNGATNNFTATNSPEWKFYNELELPNVTYGWGSNALTQQAWQAAAASAVSGITGGRIHLRSGRQNMGEGRAIAEFTRPLNGDFVLGFMVSKSSPGVGHFYFALTVPSGVSNRPRGSVIRPAFVTTLRRRFNKRTGKMEVIKNGIMTHRGYLKFLPNQRLNRRQVLRGYR